MQNVFLLDSIAEISAAMRGGLVVSGSHGGVSAARFALTHAPAFVVFNDAGIGLDHAGIAGLSMLEEHQIAAAAVSHLSARIGEAKSSHLDGVFTHVNAHALALGVRVGERCADAIARLQAAHQPD